MIDKLHRLDVSAEELAIIEEALHTQSKILNVQANAGGAPALAQLNQVKRTLATVSQQIPCETSSSRPCKQGWFSLSGIFG